MVKMTIADVTYEGSPQELKEFFEQLGAKFPVEEEYRKVVGRDPRVGDYVKYTESDSNNDVSADKYYEITGIDEDGEYEFIDDAGDISVTISSEDDFEIYEKVGVDSPQEQSLKVGDYVIPLESADDEYNITNTAMKLGKVVEELSGDYQDIRIEVVAHEIDEEVGVYYPVESKYFRKATDEEVAQAKQAHAEQKWAKIGRKPNEFKKGDIVRLLEGTGANEEGEIVEIAEDGGRSYIDECGDTYGSMTGWFELIAPVESRVDRD